MFRLVKKGTELLSLPAAKDLIERLAQLYGVGKARAMRRVEYESGAYKVSGYAALPSLTEGSRSRQTVSVNGRWVRAEGLTRGIDDAYRATVPAGRYPPVALCVGIDPRQVDVNVHPTKQLVRFSDEKEVRLAVSEAIRNAIQGTVDPGPDQEGRSTRPDTSSPYSPLASESGTDAAVTARERHPTERHPTEGYPASEPHSPIPAGKKSTGNHEGGSTSDSLFGTSKGSGSHPTKVADLSGLRKRLQQASAPLSQADSAPGVERGALPRLRDLRVVGQIGSGYILVDEPLAAWIVDQHVAHERALLDRLTGPEVEQMPTIQSLLIPEVVELSPGRC